MSFTDQPDSSFTPLRRVVAAVAGAVFLGASALKLFAPTAFLAAVMHAMSPVFSPNDEIARLAATALVATEMSLGVLLLLAPNRLIVVTAVVILLCFAAILAVRFTAKSSPSCACLGRVFPPERVASGWTSCVMYA